MHKNGTAEKLCGTGIKKCITLSPARKAICQYLFPSSLDCRKRIMDFDYDYEHTPATEKYGLNNNTTTETFKVQNVIFSVFNTVIFVLGVFGNGVVIWISGLKMKKSVNATWYLSLAVSDFVFCACLPLNIVYLVTSDWVFGRGMCKFASFVMFLNMFSSIFLLVLISVDRCVSVVFPVWSQNHRTVRSASVLVALAWIVSTLLSIPSLVYRDLLITEKRTMCYNNYPNHTNTAHHRATSVSRFVFGFVIPFLIITICYVVIIQKLRGNRRTKSSKPLKYLIRLPYHGPPSTLSSSAMDFDGSSS
ncbi:hypothetical protein COCON_G00161240 [Conger conger]|uniref:G-protein coupled receptors family 1 profile domain-containing protein n=1 Tax=Conger conger TaxID=82655 RepID=A0A9Q1DA41_CONCO|nr:hypothetical protein COCON_G00161240 [Conger conger]